MPPRLRLPTSTLRTPPTPPQRYICPQCQRFVSLASATTTPAPPVSPTTPTPTIARHPPTQPPSHKPPEFRKSQLHRQYQSLLRYSELMLVFQHNNLKATEWTAVRRELTFALQKVDDEERAKRLQQQQGGGDEGGVVIAPGQAAKLQIIQTGIFAAALRVVEFWTPDFSSSSQHETSTHGLSREAWVVVQRSRHRSHGLEPLLSGPLALLTFPTVSPSHLKAALSILAPSAPDFKAPTRRARSGYYEKAVQDGLQKLMFLGARVEGRVFDTEGVKSVGRIEGGLEGLRAQLVAMLQGVGMGVTGTLESAGRNLWVTVEGRRGMMEEEEKGEGGSGGQ